VNDSARLPLLLIVGPTASGKSSLGLEVAEVLGAEIVSADAFAVYRGLDIGTDKPSPEARRRVPHHLVDVADPRHRFSAGEFADAAEAAIDDILSRNTPALVVGGTHFYVRALLMGLFPSPPRDPAVGKRLVEEWERDPEAVFRRLEEADPEAAARIGPRDHQRLLRALEVFELTGEAISTHWDRHQQTQKFTPLMVAPKRSREDLYVKIGLRVDRMFEGGFVDEVKRILTSGVPRDAHAMKAIGYREVAEMLQGRYDLETAIERIKRSSRKLAKRQLTWLRTLREGTLHWVPPVEEDGRTAIVDLWNRHIGGILKT